MNGKSENSRNNGKCVCHVCLHHCALKEGQYGRCGARKNENGKIVCDNYGRITALAVDPIEKKPLRHFYPGSRILSVGSYGCNLSCPFCQNHEISMAGRSHAGRGEAAPESGEAPPESGEAPSDYEEISPEKVALLAEHYREYGNIGMAFTYNEPLVGYEFVRDTARTVRERGMKNVVVTNGSVTLPVLEEILPYVDAMNIDLKGFSEEYYRKLGGDLETVKAFIVRAAQSCHVELTTLIVPGENDSETEMEEEARWIASVSPDIVLHVTRFFPAYLMQDRNPTRKETVYRLRDVAGKYLKYVYTGNC